MLNTQLDIPMVVENIQLFEEDIVAHDTGVAVASVGEEAVGCSCCKLPADFFEQSGYWWVDDCTIHAVVVRVATCVDCFDCCYDRLHRFDLLIVHHQIVVVLEEHA